MASDTPGPKVFISYSWTNDSHTKWIVELASRLRTDGVDVILDRWDLKEGHDKHAFMEKMVTDPTVKKVLIVSDKLYAEKADGRRGGVGTETLIISNEVYSQVDQEKFIPILREREESGAECLPTYLKGRKYIDFCDDERFEDGYDQLLRNLYNRPALAKPPLGQAPAHLFKDDQIHAATAGDLRRLKDAVEKNKPHAQAHLEEYFDRFLAAIETCRLPSSAPKDKDLSDVVYEGITRLLPYRDDFVDFLEFAAIYMDQESTYDSLFRFLERLLPYKGRVEGTMNCFNWSFDNYRFFNCELFLYLIAVLIQKRRYAAAARFIEAEYTYTTSLGGSDYTTEGSAAFREPVESLERNSDSRRREGRFGGIAEVIRERAIHPRIKFKDLYQADFLLFIRQFYAEPGPATGWYPYLLPFHRGVGTLELFAKAKSPAGISALRHLLKVESLADFLSRTQAMLRNKEFSGYLTSSLFLTSSIPTLLNLQQLTKS